MSTTQFAFTSASEITFAVNNSTGTITISHGTDTIVIDKNSGIRRLSVINDGGTKYFVEEEGFSSMGFFWPTFVMPFLGSFCNLSLASYSGGGYTYAIIGTDDIRYVSVNECKDARWDIYNARTTKTNFLDVQVNRLGANYRARFRHSQYDTASEPPYCENLSGTPAVCITKHV